MKNLQNLLLVALAAVMMSFGWMELTGLAMLGGLVPLLILAARYDKSRRSFWAMFGWTMLFIALWYGTTVWWVWYNTPAGPIAATFFAWIYTGLPFLAWFFISKRAPKALSYTVLVSIWTVGEWVYNTNQASFPWLNIGNGFAHDIALVQWYEWTGVYGGTLWVLITNILIYEFLIVRRQRRWLPPVLAAVVPVLVSLCIYFTYHEPANVRKATVTIVQPNIDPYKDKFTLGQDAMTDNLLDLASASPPDADFVVMPETAIYERIYENRLEFNESIRKIRELAREKYPNTTFVVGATTYRYYGSTKATETARSDAGSGFYDVYNTAVALGAEGEPDVHHKSKLVIGAEMMPDWWWVRYLNKIVINMGGYVGQHGYDTVRKVFDTGEIRAGTGICYESVYGEYFSGFVRGGAEAMFIITNDGWWRDTPGYRQHFDYARLRAVETRRAIARSANTGRSGFITPCGDVRETLGWDMRGAITDDVVLSNRITFYVRMGDYLCRISLLVLGLGILYFIAYRIRKQDHIIS